MYFAYAPWQVVLGDVSVRVWSLALWHCLMSTVALGGEKRDRKLHVKTGTENASTSIPRESVFFCSQTYVCLIHPAPFVITPPLNVRPIPPRGGGALKLHQSQHNLKKNGAFGAEYFLCVFVKVTVPPLGGGGIARREGLQRGGGKCLGSVTGP